MRLAVLIAFVVGLIAMSVAAYTGEPWWRYGLEVGSFFWTLSVFTLISAVAETLQPEFVPEIRGTLAAAAAAAAAAASRERPLGTLPALPLQHLTEAWISVGGLALVVGAVLFALLALRARKHRLAQSLGALALLEAMLALGSWLGQLL
jgi:uncharacterized membrane protein YjjP (DUF1212 family)